MRVQSRLTLALRAADIVLPEVGRIAVFAPRAGEDLSALPAGRVQVITGIRPDRDHFAAQGHDCVVAPAGRYGASVVSLPRAKALARALVAQAVDVTDGPVIVDGAKTDGIESLLRDCRARGHVGAVISRAHGKIFDFTATQHLSDWSAAPQTIADGFVTAPGVFSADGIDPASRLLADMLPVRLGAHVVDLGAGWGYLSARALARGDIAHLDLVEADHAALDCARRNVADPRARFHWEDALRWRPEARADTVIMNPPFHEGRAAMPDLGRAFIRAAAGLLKPAGALWLVANRHLAYEKVLAEHFALVEDITGDSRFKILHASRPARQTR